MVKSEKTKHLQLWGGPNGFCLWDQNHKRSFLPLVLLLSADGGWGSRSKGGGWAVPLPHRQWPSSLTDQLRVSALMSSPGSSCTDQPFPERISSFQTTEKLWYWYFSVGGRRRRHVSDPGVLKNSIMKETGQNDPQDVLQLSWERVPVSAGRSDFDLLQREDTIPSHLFSVLRSGSSGLEVWFQALLWLPPVNNSAIATATGARQMFTRTTTSSKHQHQQEVQSRSYWRRRRSK